MISSVPLDVLLEPAIHPTKQVPTDHNPNSGSSQCKMPHAEEFQLSIGNEEIVLFATANYKTYTTIGTSPLAMTPVTCIVDTGTGFILIEKSFLHPTWMSRIKRRRFLKMRSANLQSIRTEEVIILHISIGVLCIQVWFGVAADLAVDVLLDFSFIDQYIRGIFPPERTLVT